MPQAEDLLRICLVVIALVTAVGLGLGLIAMIRKSMRGTEPLTEDGGDMVELLQDAFISGEIDEVEYRRAREALTEKTGAPAPLPMSPPILNANPDQNPPG